MQEVALYWNLSRYRGPSVNNKVNVGNLRHDGTTNAVLCTKKGKKRCPEGFIFGWVRNFGCSPSLYQLFTLLEVYQRYCMPSLDWHPPTIWHTAKYTIFYIYILFYSRHACSHTIARAVKLNERKYAIVLLMVKFIIVIVKVTCWVHVKLEFQT